MPLLINVNVYLNVFGWSVCICQIKFVSSHHSECQEVSSWRWVHVGTKGWPAEQEHSLGCSPQSERGWEDLRYTHLLCRPDKTQTNTLMCGWIWWCKKEEKVRDSQRMWWCKLFQEWGCGVCGLQKVLSCYRPTQALHHHVTGRWNRTPKRH